MIPFTRCVVLIFLFCCVCPAVAAPWLYKEGQSGKPGVILCHGKGGNPRSFVVDPLRIALNDELGFYTLSLQMPGGRKALEEYRDDFPAAYKEIDRAVSFLRGKGISKIYLIAHSLGSRMATSYLARTPGHAITGFVGVGMLNNNGEPFSCLLNLQKIDIPVLDIWGDAGGAGDKEFARERRVLISKRYTQKAIPDGDHALSENEEELVEAVADWLRLQESGR